MWLWTAVYAWPVGGSDWSPNPSLSLCVLTSQYLWIQWKEYGSQLGFSSVILAQRKLRQEDHELGILNQKQIKKKNVCQSPKLWISVESALPNSVHKGLEEGHASTQLSHLESTVVSTGTELRFSCLWTLWRQGHFVVSLVFAESSWWHRGITC